MVEVDQRSPGSPKGSEHSWTFTLHQRQLPAKAQGRQGIRGQECRVGEAERRGQEAVRLQVLEPLEADSRRTSSSS